MYLRLVVAGLWLADLISAKPVANRLSLYPRQAVTTDVSPGLTTTSTGATVVADLELPPLCIVTVSVSPDETCKSVAEQYGVPLSAYEARSLAISDDCRYLLEGYRICVDVLPVSSTSASRSRSSSSIATKRPSSTSRTTDSSSSTFRSSSSTAMERPNSTSRATDSSSSTLSTKSHLSEGTSKGSSATTTTSQSTATPRSVTVPRSTTTTTTSKRVPIPSSTSKRTSKATSLTVSSESTNTSQTGRTRTRTRTVTITACSRKPVPTTSWNSTMNSTRISSGSLSFLPSSRWPSLTITSSRLPTAAPSRSRSILSSPGFPSFNITSSSLLNGTGTAVRTVTGSQGTGSALRVRKTITITTTTTSLSTTSVITRASLAARAADQDHLFNRFWHGEGPHGHTWLNPSEESSCSDPWTYTTIISSPAIVEPLPTTTSATVITSVSVPVSTSPSLSKTEFTSSTSGSSTTQASTSTIVSTTAASSTSTTSQAVSPVLTSSSSSFSSSSSSSSSSASPSSSAVTATTTSSTTSQPCLAARAVAPAPTQSGIVAGCTLFYVAQSGDDCIAVAERFDISVNDFIGWNPAVGLDCSGLMTNDAYCVDVCGSTSTSLVLASTQTAISTSFQTLSSIVTTSSSILTTAVSTSSTALTSIDLTTLTAALPTSTGSGVDVYKTYTGDGSVAAGWPSMDQWVSFDYMFDANTPTMKAACSQWGVPDNSDAELDDVRSSILSIASDSGVDARFILAIIMQESTGCVRVITTAYSVFNPGLMQSHNGTGTCNTNSASLLVVAGTGVVQTPCPASEIQQMIVDGVEGTSTGDGLEQLLADQGHTDVSRWYRTARAYNGGSIAASGDLGEGCCTLCYVSDIANRLTGWVNAEHSCTL